MKKKLIDTPLTDDEIVDAMVPPVALTATEKNEADLELAGFRKVRRDALGKDEQQLFQLRKLRVQLEEYINTDQFQPEKNFGFFLGQYIKAAKRKQVEFAKDVDIHRTTVTNLLKHRKKPNDSLMIRLEIHSGNTIPAIDWFKLHEMEKGYEIRTSKSLREKERAFVKHSLDVLD
ncbi:hypothetical protein [Mucilaginibacter dorajii]|uniref:HTH cro/C1-type domain-containing protein n=1 Tax=Mucilaginibacter dorajii TaxID=692994 RepID=A0ABP7PMH1_9SPHI|nr:hypothetical protein [Mucilaginibacter dorajii]MCS3733713.1 plasmid maintenance system antidote protein VapI [Mucilaginibacter dorajii]